MKQFDFHSCPSTVTLCEIRQLARRSNATTRQTHLDEYRLGRKVLRTYRRLRVEQRVKERHTREER